MPRSQPAETDLRRRAGRIVRALAKAYPDARCALAHRNAFELLVATILSAQCTDARVNHVTPPVFARYPDAAALALADPTELESLIHATGFFRAKAKSLLGMATALVERHGGEVPRDLDALTNLPGVGRKTANVVRGVVFGLASGIVVDTHVKRLAFRLGLSTQTDPEKVERDLMPLIPRARWVDIAHLLIEHGRKVCKAPRPRCEECPLDALCPKCGVAGA